MTELKHQFAYQVRDGKVTHVTEAEVGVDYEDYNGNTLIFKAIQSSFMQPHFSYTPSFNERDINRNSSAYNEFLSKSDSIHSVIIQEFLISKTIEINGNTIKAHSAVAEKATIQGSRLVPDITFYDANGEILLCIEVAVTHACEADKIKELNEKGIDTIEINYNRNGSNNNKIPNKYFGSNTFKSFCEGAESEKNLKGIEKRILDTTYRIDSLKKEKESFTTEDESFNSKSGEQEFIKREVERRIRDEVYAYESRFISETGDIKRQIRRTEEDIEKERTRKIEVKPTKILEDEELGRFIEKSFWYDLKITRRLLQQEFTEDLSGLI